MLYGIFHIYSVDGGFGDAVPKEDLLFVTDSEDLAKEYVKKWSHPYIYDTPYQALTCGRLGYCEIEQLYTGEIDQSPMDILGKKENLPGKYEWLRQEDGSINKDLDLWRVENRPDGWDEGNEDANDNTYFE